MAITDMTKNIVAGIAVSVAVSSFAVSMAFGTLTGNVASLDADVEMLKRVRTEFREDSKIQQIELTALGARIDTLEEKEQSHRATILCILSSEDQGERLRCISNPNRNADQYEDIEGVTLGPLYSAIFKDN